MLHFEFVAQAVPHQCIAHHGAEHRAAAAAERTTNKDVSALKFTLDVVQSSNRAQRSPKNT